MIVFNLFKLQLQQQAQKLVNERGAAGTEVRTGTSLIMLACIWQPERSNPGGASLPHRDRGIGLVQGFYKERAAVGCVASQPQLTPLICSRLSSFSAVTGGGGPDPH